MQLEDYLEFIDPDEIRLKGHRIGIEDIIKYYLDGYTPEQILQELPTLNLEKIYAAIAYYLHNRFLLDAYLLRLWKRREQHYQEFVNHPSPLRQRLKAAKQQRQEEKLNNESSVSPR
ncbi:DUF433 domain-containing protein [Lyngbya sp. CCY1209]|jgi:uncharacterized protein (DUF433 family)|uniref:DUF433 domain-containing protein n=1 Tax=Lyngbya sp. CCY1209 TaxID=2886103 RepID=UPI002D212978|nr:DUF433 domain-containing protein [Lyngbya sp. CCY1209]MEB3883367.1 DUF433 domain-containing protein [Lyngbya sp. CCY1209]